MDTPIVTAEAEIWAGGTVALAKLLGISHNAISQWGAHMPERRADRLRLLKPGWFFKNGKLRPPAIWRRDQA